MTIQADHSGLVRGKFAVPANIPAGTKRVEFIGDRGTRGVGQFIGRGTISVVERQTVTVVERYDPLAQTFTLPGDGRHISAVGLWFRDIGTKPVTVQIRTVANGVPTGVVRAQSRKVASELKADDETVFKFNPPLYVEADQEMAIVVLTDDDRHSLWIAEVGQYEQRQKKYITEQAYGVGVLLSSSNASTWTPHNNGDLAFRLYGAKFTASEQVYELADITASNSSDYYIMAGVERPAVDTDLQLELTAGDKSYKSQELQSIRLDERTNGPIKSKVRLFGSAHHSPILYPGTSVALGQVRDEGTYISRAIPAGSGKAILTLESNLPQGAALKVELEINGQWRQCTPQNGEPLGDNWLRNEYSQNITGGDTVRCRLTLTGNVSARPQVRNLRMVTT